MDASAYARRQSMIRKPEKPKMCAPGCNPNDPDTDCSTCLSQHPEELPENTK